MDTLTTIFGQEAAVSALRRALSSGSIVGSYLLVGPAGVGKSAFANAFARAAACLEPRLDPFDGCGVCDSCRRLESGTHPDILTISPAGEQTQIFQFWDRDNRPPGVLSRTLNYAPTLGRKRVYIIEQCDTLTPSAANSLLKVLEEPPPYALFLLLAPHASRVLPTILSRCQMVRINAAPVQQLAGYLHESLHIAWERAEMLASYAEGRVGQAVRMAEVPGVSAEIAQVMDFAESLPRAALVRSLKSAEQMRKLAVQMKGTVGAEPADAGESGESEAVLVKEKVGRRQLAIVFDLLTSFYRDLLVVSSGDMSARLIINKDRSQSINLLAEAGTPERWMYCIDSLMIARRRLDANANIALVTEILAMALLGQLHGG